jgi:hypothetical protein
MSDIESIIDIDPTPEKRPILPGGKYGEAGEATLESIKLGKVKYGMDTGKPCINTRVSILTNEYGYVSQFTDWPLEGARKNITLKMLNNLGLDLDAMKGEDGRVRFDGSLLNGTKVIVDLHYREYDRRDSEGNVTGERGQANDVRMLWRRE